MQEGQSSVSVEDSFVRSEAGGQMARNHRKGRHRQVLTVGHVGSALTLLTARELFPSPYMLVLALLCHLPLAVRAGWGNGDGSASIYSASERRNEWMDGASQLNVEYVGCVWGTVEGGEEYHEDFVCREDESEDGTYYWYQMASCRRAQVAYNVYSGGSCSSTSFKESYMTKTGLSEFIDTMNTYDGNSPLYNVAADDFPMCEEDGYGYYLSLGCDGDGGFAVNKFSDDTCLQYYGEDDSGNYDLSDINYALADMQSCYDAYDSSSGISVYQTALSYLLGYSEPCTSIDSPLCTDSQEFGSSSSGFHHKNKHSASGASIANKLKYVLGALLLVASVTMFMGILFTNRRRRRAMMHRRFRQSASRSRSSRSRRGQSSRSKSRTRSSSRKRRESRGDREGGVSGGVFT